MAAVLGLVLGCSAGLVAVHVLLLGAAPVAYAGGGAENVAVVVNPDSWSSMTIANEFVHLRRVPACNVIYLDDPPDLGQTNVDLFREKILKPALETLQRRGLADQIDYLAYSSDLPTAIDVGEDMKGKQFPKVVTRHASINGLTYLHQYVLRANPNYLRPDINRYARRAQPALESQSIPQSQQEAYVSALKLTGEEKWSDAATAFGRIAQEVPGSPDLLYNLACCLAQEGKADEAMACLTRAVEAGFLNSGSMQGDADLKALHDREDFGQLLEGMRTRVFGVQPTQGFRGTDSWGESGQVGAAGGSRYLLSTVLGVTNGRGNSVKEVLRSL